MKQEHQRATQDLRHGHQPKRSDNERRSGVSIYRIANELQLCDGDGMMEISWNADSADSASGNAHSRTPTHV